MHSDFPSREAISETTANMLLEIDAVHFNAEKPFTFTSGIVSPVYIDCRKIISYPRVRDMVTAFSVSIILRDIGFEQLDAVAGGETAGIPFAAWIAKEMGLPMHYVRKKPKGFGRAAQIEGDVRDDQRVLLVEDLTTDGGSKISFVDAIRETGATCAHTAVIFYYGIFDGVEKTLGDHGVQLLHLCTWWDVLAEAKAQNTFDTATLDGVEAFLNDPRGWQEANKKS